MVHIAVSMVWLALATGQVFAQATPESDPHRAARRFVEASGFRDKFAQMMDAILENAVKQLPESLPPGLACSQEYTVEWKKRFAARVTADQIAVFIIPIFEKHFTSDELDQLSAAQAAANAGKGQELPPVLRDKVQKNGAQIQSEIINVVSQMGEKAGAEVGQEIGTEHPGWCTQKH